MLLHEDHSVIYLMKSAPNLRNLWPSCMLKNYQVFIEFTKKKKSVELQNLKTFTYIPIKFNLKS